jgi:hypothetical protein
MTRWLPPALLLLLAACSTPRAAPAPVEPMPSSGCTPADRRRALDEFIAVNHDGYLGAIGQARLFLEPLDLDPEKLRAHGIKGKKKLVEALDAYYALYRFERTTEREIVLLRVKELAAVTTEDRYHDMLTVPDGEFKEDATSYLRAALLLDRMGVDVTRYKAEIARMKPRLDAHMRERGPHQQRAFHTYYEHFHLTEPFPLGGALESGFIAARADPEKLGRFDVYAFTHEIFSAYEFGDRLDAEPWTPADRAYLRVAAPRLAALWLAKRDPDLLAELVTCLRYLRLTGAPVYVDALRYLLAEQRPDGSWGDYETARARLGDLVKQGFYLHTVMVVIEALTLAFDETSRQGEGPVCPTRAPEGARPR